MTFLMVGEVSMLAHVSDQLKGRFLVKSASIISLVPGYDRQGHFLKRTISVDNFGWHLELDEHCVHSVLDKSGTAHSKSVVARRQ